MSTVLFVDDHHAIRTVFAEILRSAGHIVLEAGALADAEHLVERHSGAIDLLIVEAVLTTANGLDVARRIESVHPEMQVLFVSEEPAENLFQEGLLPKGAQFLPEPFEAEELIAKLQQLAKAGKRRASRKPLRAGARKS